MNQTTNQMPSMYQNRARNVQHAGRPRTVGLAYLVFFLTGMVGWHMLYVRRPGLAVAKLFTLNFFFFGMLVDLFLLPQYVRAANS